MSKKYLYNDVNFLNDQLHKAQIEKDYFFELLNLEKNNQQFKIKYRNASEKMQILKVKLAFFR